MAGECTCLVAHREMGRGLAAPDVGVAERIPKPAHCSLSSFTVEKPTVPDLITGKVKGKFRFILNGVPLTKYLKKYKFTMESLEKWLETGPRGFQVRGGKLDIKDGFHSVEIDEEDRNFLGYYVLDEQGEPEYYRSGLFLWV